MSDDLPKSSAKPANGSVSRRLFLRKWLSGAALTVTGTLSALVVSKPAGAQGWGYGPGWGWGGSAWGPGWGWGFGYVPKAAARYQDQPNRGRRCGGCRYFRGPNFCAVVEGLISPNGWCMYHDPRGRLPGPAPGGRAAPGAGGRGY
jgi:hypothetical protein